MLKSIIIGVLLGIAIGLCLVALAWDKFFVCALIGFLLGVAVTVTIGTVVSAKASKPWRVIPEPETEYDRVERLLGDSEAWKGE